MRVIEAPARLSSPYFTDRFTLAKPRESGLSDQLP